MAFLSWMKEQPFYENTTVILCGDHLTMDSDFFDDLDPEYQRSVFNLFLNTNKKTVNNQNRQFSAMDMFPTTLSALGVKISGNRLGLGTNLFSKEPTIIEKLGYDTFESELMKRSKFYDEKLIMNEVTTESE
jgi:phosphoglycerol transferase